MERFHVLFSGEITKNPRFYFNGAWWEPALVMLCRYLCRMEITKDVHCTVAIHWIDSIKLHTILHSFHLH